ncbi:hypothetical protein [Dactylosporangium sp. NPDC006015]|uniref:hypothetical protein n=1 Tax=Dactylosporangium sp. NPDC006015 TaxID=3154576 RepID=UPI0033B0A33E
MAWDWVGPLSGAVIGAAGVASGVWIASSARKHELRLSKERHQHERAAAQEQWIRDRRADAYVELLEMAEVVGMWIVLVHPMIGPRPDPPPLPSFEAQQRVFARVMAFGSRDAKVKADQWRLLVARATRVAESISHNDDGNARETLEDLRQQERAARQEMGKTVAIDLQDNGQARIG